MPLYERIMSFFFILIVAQRFLLQMEKISGSLASLAQKMIPKTNKNQCDNKR